MIYLLALLAGVLGAALGAGLGYVIGALLAELLGIPSFEGASGFFIAAIMLLAGVIGLMAGLLLTLRYAGGFRGFKALTGRAAALLAVMGALIFIGVQVRFATLENFPGDYPVPQLHFEIRLPAGVSEPQRSRIDFEMQAGSQRSGGQFADGWLRKDGDRYVMSGRVPLYTRTSQRILVVSLPDQPRLLFSIGLSAMPAASETFGPWQRVSFIDDGKPDSQPRRPNNSENFEIRYHVPEWRQ
jgi:hypothetical protein